MRIRNVYQALKGVTFEEIYIKIIETKETKVIYTPFYDRKEKARKNYEKYCQCDIEKMEFWKRDLIIFIHDFQKLFKDKGVI